VCCQVTESGAALLCRRAVLRTPALLLLAPARAFKLAAQTTTTDGTRAARATLRRGMACHESAVHTALYRLRQGNGQDADVFAAPLPLRARGESEAHAGVAELGASTPGVEGCRDVGGP
jgi:hypothetical protein